MKILRRIVWTCIAVGALWLCLCAAMGVIVGESALHPDRSVITPREEAQAAAMAQRDDLVLTSVELRADDGVVLKAWQLHPARWNGNYVFILHGQGDNRASMLGIADLLVRHQFGVLVPDARAHGMSGGAIATYGVIERNDVRDWFEWMKASRHPHCIDAIGESMGAAQVLESLSEEPAFCAVIAESPFASFREAGYDRIGQQFNTGPWLGRTVLRPAIELGLLYARVRYGVQLSHAVPAESAAESHVPILLIHGLKDDDLPPRHSEMILMLSRGRNEHVSLWEVANGGHTNAMSTEPAEYERRVIGWLNVHDQDAKGQTQRP